MPIRVRIRISDASLKVSIRVPSILIAPGRSHWEAHAETPKRKAEFRSLGPFAILRETDAAAVSRR
jgi:hypothetical protein